MTNAQEVIMKKASESLSASRHLAADEFIAVAEEKLGPLPPVAI
jgi:hypothetical protein